MQIDSLDHLVLTVADLDATTRWYARVLGLTPVVRGDRYALQVGEQKINLHQRDHTFEPKAARPTPGSGDLCLITRSAVADVLTRLRETGTPVEVGPVPRQGARGAMTSVYVRDPDANLVEIARYDTDA